MRPSIVWLVLAVALLADPARGAVAPRGTARGTGRNAVPAAPLPWIADDWPRALEVARQRHLPIFVENWAPW